MSKPQTPPRDPARSLLRDLRAHQHAAVSLEATAPDACARLDTGALLAAGRPCGAGFWSFAPDEDTWQELAFEGQAQFRGQAGDAIDPTLTIGRTGK